ncbi:MAG: DUF4982 domain-containing protein [Bacteroidales bacterium]|jgi:beta-galactosidase/beta-glucuronidase|nr:DUF4982 domain-containing protein [Bacteroidales bacterium]
MRQLLLLILTITALSVPSYSQVSFGQPENINNGWRFTLSDPSDVPSVNFDDSKWRKLDLPHDWSIEGTLSPTLASCTGYLPGGIGWYRKTLNIPSEKKEGKVFIYFEGIYNNSEVFINGHSLGTRPNGYISFMYDLTPYIQYGEENILAVRVDHSLSADSRWYTGSGIYRNVYLVYSGSIHIDQWGVFCQARKVTGKEALLEVQVDVKNETSSTRNLTVQVELLSADGRSVSKNTKKIASKANSVDKNSLEIKVKNPELWDIERPYLYSVKTQILQNGKVIDESLVKTGIRTLTFDANKGFALNGQWMKMKGVCIHHDAGCLGAAVPRKVWERRLKNLKNLGCNAIRTSHNPQAPDVYELCDELGFLVMDEAFDEWEFPKKKWLEGWNVGKPGFQGSASFFNEWSNKDIQAMVLRDRNHPSIVMWSIGNEVDYPNDPYSHPSLNGSTFSQPVYGGYLPDNPPAERLGGIAKRLVADVKQLDASRPVTAALAGVIMSNETEYPSAVDITGYNYTENRYDSDHQKYPERIIYGSENGHGMDSWKATRDKEHIFGQFLWTGIDYLGEAGRWPSRGFYSGLLDFGGFQKPRGYFRQALWDTRPMIYIGTYPAPDNPRQLSLDAWSIWNYEQGQIIRVVCYTNCEKAKLLLDGKETGTLKDYDDHTGIISWDIPYQAGKLEAVGYKGDKEVCRYDIRTSGRPDALTVLVDNPHPDKNKDLVHVTVQVVDMNGIPVMISDEEITCVVEGPAKLLGLEASNNSDMGNYRDNKQRAFHGRLLAYIQTTGTEGTVKVKFSAPWLKPVETILSVSN